MACRIEYKSSVAHDLKNLDKARCLSIEETRKRVYG